MRGFEGILEDMEEALNDKRQQFKARAEMHLQYCSQEYSVELATIHKLGEGGDESDVSATVQASRIFEHTCTSRTSVRKFIEVC